jgi:hypothetical protein
MDSTYIIALILSAIIGCLAASAFIAIGGRSVLRLLLVATVIAVVAEFFLLINWAAADAITWEFLLFDFAIFSVYGVFGCLAGILPVLGIRALYRLLNRQGH